jgi:hypothetical protein
LRDFNGYREAGGQRYRCRYKQILNRGDNQIEEAATAAGAMDPSACARLLGGRNRGAREGEKR